MAGKLFSKFTFDEGQELNEYALLVVLVVVAAVACFGSLAHSISNVLKDPYPGVPRKLHRTIRTANSLFGNIAFNPIPDMEVDRAYEIHLDLSVSKTLPELENELRSELKDDPAVVDVARIQISDEMEARLTGETFKIIVEGDEAQGGVTGGRDTHWRWQVTPTRGGTRTLHLTVSTITSVDGTPYPHAVQTFDKDISVHVTTGRRLTDWFHDNGLDIEVGSSIVGALALWEGIRKLIQKMRKKKESPPDA